MTGALPAVDIGRHLAHLVDTFATLRRTPRLHRHVRKQTQFILSSHVIHNKYEDNLSKDFRATFDLMALQLLHADVKVDIGRWATSLAQSLRVAPTAQIASRPHFATADSIITRRVENKAVCGVLEGGEGRLQSLARLLIVCGPRCPTGWSRFFQLIPGTLALPMIMLGDLKAPYHNAATILAPR
ncbi:hypothetical protein RR46_09707 [Papilio xuthus]|uniref:Uncharacterized protein n=1 Tax=Papilio xuthus TaxID=66420 RepID=A0A194QAP4_PAPXU|nr:hypothetical protein RR46_09707 [Papilio xuthus]